MDDYPLEIEGAWIRICCRLYWSGGTATKTLKQWSGILRADLRQTRRIFAFFLLHNICDLVNQKDNVTITSRRIVRDEYIRKIRKESGIKGGNPVLKHGKDAENLVNQNDKQKPTPSSSSSFKEESLVKDSLSAEESADVKIPPCPHEKIIELYHEILPMMARVREPYGVYWNGVRKKHLATRWKESEEHQDLDFWTTFFTWVKSDCPFLLGQGRDGWKADIGWLICPGNFVKVLEGGNRYRLQKQRGRE
jgi:hypothetical protein